MQSNKQNISYVCAAGASVQMDQEYQHLGRGSAFPKANPNYRSQEVWMKKSESEQVIGISTVAAGGNCARKNRNFETAGSRIPKTAPWAGNWNINFQGSEGATIPNSEMRRKLWF